MKDEPAKSRNWFIADTPLSEAEKDAFGHPDVANNLLRMLREPHQGRRMIGLLGSFGVGKSSVVELLGKSLAGDRDHALIRVSAERHEIENFHRSFVFSVAEAIVERDLATRPQTEQIISRLEYSTTESWSSFKLSGVGRLVAFLGSRLRSKLGKSLAIVGGAVLLGLVLLTVILAVNGFFATDTVARVITWGAAFVGSIATTLTAVPLVSFFRSAVKQVDPFKPGQSSSMRPRAEAADEYERVFASLIDLTKSRLVIAVDDVDRLDQREILPALNAIRSFQLTAARAKQPTFIVSLDDTIIAKALVAERVDQDPSRREDADVLIDEYLNRLFTLRQTMPLHAKRDLRSYARDLLSSEHRGAEKLGADLETVLNILIHDGVQSPRHVIRLLNAFFADYRLAIRREQSADGRRAINSGLVSSAPAVLARMTVLKNDYPSFFSALVVDTRLLATVESDVRGTLDEVSAGEMLDVIGLEAESNAYSGLKRFIGRTATWTEPVDDLLPFLYLGQDSLERSMGSADARRAVSALSNRQIAEFAQLLADADSAPEAAKHSYVESIVDATRTLGGLELGNALATIAENAESASKLSAEIADAFADGIVRAPSTSLRVDGLSIMLGAVSSDKHRDEIARILATAPEESGSEWIASLLDNDAAIASYAPAIAQVRDALQQALERLVDDEKLDDLESYAIRLRVDSDAKLAELVLASTFEAFVRSDDDLTEAFVSSTESAAVALPHHALSARMGKAAASVIRKGVSTNGSLAVLKMLEAAELNDPKQLADLTYAWLSSATTSARDALADGFSQDTFDAATWMVMQSIRLAPGYTGSWGTRRKVPIPRQIAEVLAMHVDARKTIYPTGNEIVAALLETRPEDVTPIAVSAARLLTRATEELDDDERGLLESLLTNSEKVSDEGLLPLQAALRQTLLLTADPALRDQATSLLPLIRDRSKWESWLEQVITETAAAPDQTLTSVQAASRVILATSPTEPSTSSAAAVLEMIRNRMVPYRHFSLAVDVAGKFAWPQAHRAQVLEMIAPYLEQGQDASIEAVFNQLGQTPRESLTPTAVTQFQTVADDRLKHDPATQSMVIHHLQLDDAFEMALEVGLEAHEVFGAALDDAPADEVATFIDGAPTFWVGQTSSTSDNIRLLGLVARKSEESFIAAVEKLLSDFLSSDDSVLIPERLGEIVEAFPRSAPAVVDAVLSGLEGAAHDVLIAMQIADAMATSRILDESLAEPLAQAIWRWSRDELEEEIAVRIARSVRSGPASRAATLTRIGPRGPVKQPAKSIYLAVKKELS